MRLRSWARTRKRLLLLGAGIAGLLAAAVGAWDLTRDHKPIVDDLVIRYATGCVDAVDVHTARTPRIALAGLVNSARHRHVSVFSRHALAFLGQTAIPLQRHAVQIGGTNLHPWLIAITHHASATTITKRLACGGYRPTQRLATGTIYKPTRPPVLDPDATATLPRWPVVYTRPGLAIGARSRAELQRALRALGDN